MSETKIKPQEAIVGDEKSADVSHGVILDLGEERKLVRKIDFR